MLIEKLGQYFVATENPRCSAKMAQSPHNR